MHDISEEQVVRSALWSAYGDVVGFPTELITHDAFAKKYKTKEISGPIDWSRRVGGLFGPEVPFPVGTYSDDTQLRLATSRAIRGDGYFDVGSFAKVELPVWLNYALGAGRGSKAAAANLSLRETSWSQNFYQSNAGAYWHGGGNGAAMRIQPHVWKGHRSGLDVIVRDVIKNTICTHGHPRAIIGAAIHAVFLYETLQKRKPISPNDWASLGETAAIQAYEALVEDPELSLVWIPNWENQSGLSLNAVWAATVLEWHEAVDIAAQASSTLQQPDEIYRKLVSKLGCFQANERGSGLKTPLLASVLAWLYKDNPPEDALLLSANTFGSDTDTIGTMAGALIGALANCTPSVEIQDAAYIAEEAKRIYRIGLQKEKQPSFRYPDPLTWSPPRNQSDALVEQNGKLSLRGIGELLLLGKPFAATKGNDILWQWGSLPFGQMILAKRRANLLRSTEQVTASPILKEKEHAPVAVIKRHKILESKDDANEKNVLTVDEYTQNCIRTGFNPLNIGESLLALAQGPEGIERAIAFAAIVAKAKIARDSR